MNNSLQSFRQERLLVFSCFRRKAGLAAVSPQLHNHYQALVGVGDEGVVFGEAGDGLAWLNHSNFLYISLLILSTGGSELLHVQSPSLLQVT